MASARRRATLAAPVLAALLLLGAAVVGDAARLSSESKATLAVESELQSSANKKGNKKGPKRKAGVHPTGSPAQLVDEDAAESEESNEAGQSEESEESSEGATESFVSDSGRDEAQGDWPMYDYIKSKFGFSQEAGEVGNASEKAAEGVAQTKASEEPESELQGYHIGLNGKSMTPPWQMGRPPWGWNPPAPPTPIGRRVKRWVFKVVASSSLMYYAHENYAPARAAWNDVNRLVVQPVGEKVGETLQPLTQKLEPIAEKLQPLGEHVMEQLKPVGTFAEDKFHHAGDKLAKSEVWLKIKTTKDDLVRIFRPVPPEPIILPTPQEIAPPETEEVDDDEVDPFDFGDGVHLEKFMLKHQQAEQQAKAPGTAPTWRHVADGKSERMQTDCDENGDCYVVVEEEFNEDDGSSSKVPADCATPQPDTDSDDADGPELEVIHVPVDERNEGGLDEVPTAPKTSERDGGTDDEEDDTAAEYVTAEGPQELKKEQEYREPDGGHVSSEEPEKDIDEEEHLQQTAGDEVEDDVAMPKQVDATDKDDEAADYVATEGTLDVSHAKYAEDDGAAEEPEEPEKQQEHKDHDEGHVSSEEPQPDDDAADDVATSEQVDVEQAEEEDAEGRQTKEKQQQPQPIAATRTNSANAHDHSSPTKSEPRPVGTKASDLLWADWPPEMKVVIKKDKGIYGGVYELYDELFMVNGMPVYHKLGEPVVCRMGAIDDWCQTVMWMFFDGKKWQITQEPIVVNVGADRDSMKLHESKFWDAEEPLFESLPTEMNTRPDKVKWAGQVKVMDARRKGFWARLNPFNRKKRAAEASLLQTGQTVASDKLEAHGRVRDVLSLRLVKLCVE